MTSIARGTWRWDGRIEFSFPYNRTLVDALKNHIHPQDREWDSQRKVWIIDTSSAAAMAMQLVRSHYRDLEIVDNRYTYQSPPPPPRFNTEPQVDSNFAMLYILESAPRCVADAAYKALSKECHPDRVPERERAQAHEKMIALTNAYERVRDRVAS